MKENQNKINTNLWSGGEYNNSLNGITCEQDNQKIIISEDWSAIGETSFKITRGGGTRYNWCRFNYPNSPNKTTTATLKIYSPNATADIRFTEMKSAGESVYVSTRIYPSEQIQTISLTYTTPSDDALGYFLRIDLNNDGTVLYVDDIQINQ